VEPRPRFLVMAAWEMRGRRKRRERRRNLGLECIELTK
jgi:hypothetical protein